VGADEAEEALLVAFDGGGAEVPGAGLVLGDEDAAGLGEAV